MKSETATDALQLYDNKGMVLPGVKIFHFQKERIQDIVPHSAKHEDVVPPPVKHEDVVPLPERRCCLTFVNRR